MAENINPVYSLDFSYLANLDLDSVNSMLERYPFAHNLRTLRILASKARKDFEYQKLLNSDTIFIPDRTHLKQLIDNMETIINQEVEEKPVIEEKHKEPEKIITPEINMQNEDIEIASEEIPEFSVLEKDEAEINNENIVDLDSEVEIDDNALIVDKEKPMEINDVGFEEMETNEIVDQASNFSLDEDEELSGFSKWLKEKSRNPEHVIEPQKSEPNIRKETKNEWEGLQEKILSNYHAESGKSGDKEHSKKKKKKLKTKIVETEVVTEPYAVLLEQQGKTGKAIKIYEKLSLIFPEKTSYFADKIESLKNK